MAAEGEMLMAILSHAADESGPRSLARDRVGPLQ